MKFYFNALKSLIVLLLLSSFTIFADANNRKWSANVGKLNWSDAKANCVKLGMRLPTLEELATSYEKNELNPWKKDGNAYWTSNEISKDRAYYFTLLNGVKFSLAKDKAILVRCIV